MHRTKHRPLRCLLLPLLLLGCIFTADLMLAQEPAAAAPAAAVEGQAETKKSPETLFELVLAGGYVMIPIGLCSVLALGIILERLISLRRERIIPSDFLDNLKKAIGDVNDPNIDAGVAYCNSLQVPIAEIFRAGVARLGDGREAIERAIEDAGARQVHKLKRSLRPLSTIAAVAPLLGLLGTVYGMITAFQAVSGSAVNKVDTLSQGIYTSLVTTAAGLTLAIPVLIVYNWMCTKVDSLVDDIDDEAIAFLEYSTYGKEAALVKTVKDAEDGEGPGDQPETVDEASTLEDVTA